MFRLLFSALAMLTFGSLFLQNRCLPDESKRDMPSVEEQKAELAKLCEIFASVEKLPAQGARWVEVQAGSTDQKSLHRGWLLRDSKDEMELLTADGWKQKFEKKKLTAHRLAPDFTVYDVRAVRNGDFAKFCREFLVEKKIETKDDPNEFGVYRFQRERAAADAAVIDAARLACWASKFGEEELSDLLLKKALTNLKARRDTYIGLPVSGKLHQFVADATSPHLVAHLGTRLDTGVPSPSSARRDSLDWNRAIAKIPYRSDHEATLKKIKSLERLVAEDLAWREPTKEEFAKMDVNRKAAYWLYHLRDLNVTQTSQPGMCWVLTDSRWSFMQTTHLADEGTPNAAVELKKLGYGVLPQIIAHLEDDRPTRCVGFWRNFAPESYYTLTYGDCCQQIFEAIALHSIYERSSTSGYPLRDGQGKQCKERAERWWQEFQTKGEKQTLIESTIRGDRDSPLNAERLVKNFPDLAFESVRAGIRAAQKDWIRSNLLNYMRKLKDNRVVDFLCEETKGPFLTTRVSAAVGLLERGNDEGATVLVAEWKKLDPEAIDRFGSWDPEQLQSALVHSGKAEAINVLKGKWKQMPADWKHHTLETMREADKDFTKKPFTPETTKAIEEHLLFCLTDREEGYRRLRTCDLAAAALVRRWGDPKMFDSSAPLSNRNKRIVEIQNVWRKKQGLALLSVPQPRKIPDADVAIISPLLKAIVDSSLPDKAAEAVERLGIGGLPHVRKQLNSLSEDHPARKRLSKLASRLACIVTEIHFSEDSIAQPNAMRNAAKWLRSRPLSETEFVDFLIAIHKLVPSESSGIAIALDRDGNDTGIQLEIRVLPHRDPPKGGTVHLRRHEIVVLDGQEIINNGSTAAGISRNDETPTVWAEADWKGLSSALRNALDAPPEKTIQVRVAVTRGR